VLFYDLLHITGKKVAENERVNRFEETKNRLLNRKVKIQVDLVKGLTNIQFRGVWS
jgi:septation ring formation regulator EzrA